MDSSLSRLKAVAIGADESVYQSYSNTDIAPFDQDGYALVRSDKDADNHGGNDDRQVLLAITVEIEEGRMEVIAVREGDSAAEVASKFCRDHAIPERYVSPLAEHIVTKLQDIREQEG